MLLFPPIFLRRKLENAEGVHGRKARDRSEADQVMPEVAV